MDFGADVGYIGCLRCHSQALHSRTTICVSASASDAQVHACASFFSIHATACALMAYAMLLLSKPS
eukprot:scaffold135725_cov31-Tisochrysis_lutea.AAC.1